MIGLDLKKLVEKCSLGVKELVIVGLHMQVELGIKELVTVELDMKELELYMKELEKEMKVQFVDTLEGKELDTVVEPKIVLVVALGSNTMAVPNMLAV